MKTKNNSRLTFNTSTNLLLPISVQDVLYADAYLYGWVKNHKSNISGFINHIIPMLSEYQDDLRERLLAYNNGNEEITKIVEQNIFNIYLPLFDIQSDPSTNVPFRINQKNYDEFLNIHDTKLLHYNTNFTDFVRKLLVEYSKKSPDQREILYAYRIVKKIKDAIADQRLCHFHCGKNKVSAVPVQMEASPVSRKNIIFGMPEEDRIPYIIPLYTVTNLVVDNKTMTITDEDCQIIYEAQTQYYYSE